ncbi:MAG: hypothetical protein J7L46_00305 [Bacteroidales bacterium]|nr:hypothetical protein [Bacteroidales bacterium]
MRKVKWFLAIVVLAGFSFSCNNAAKEENNNEVKTDSVVANADEVVAIDFNKLNGDEVFDLNGKMVKISGLVDHVCKHGGKRLMLVGTNPGERVRVEASDNPPFKEDVVGTNIEVTGKLVAEKVDSTYLANWEEEIKQETLEGKNTVEPKHIEGKGEHKKGENEGQADITTELEKIQQLREEIKTNGKGFIGNFSIEFESLKPVE